MREADLAGRATQDIETNEQQIKQEQAGLSTTRYNLNQVIITAPMDGLVTRRNIEEGETAVVGTMNNAGIGAADDRRHVGDRSRSRSGRDRHPDRGARPGGQGHDRRGPRPDVQGPRDRDRQQPDSDDTTPEHGTATGHHVQGRHHARGTGARRPSRLHLHRRDHDGEAEGRRGGADSGADRARDALQRQGRAGARDAEPPPTWNEYRDTV